MVGCAVGPQFASPQMPLPSHWQAGEGSENACVPFQWWESFVDGDMENLFQRVEEANPDLHSRRFAIEEAWANRRLHVAGRRPRLDGTAGYAGDTADVPEREFGLEVAWELDIFGRHQRRKEVSTREFESAVERWRNGLLFLRAEVALYYTDIRVSENRLDLIRENIDIYQEIVKVTKGKVAEGMIGDVELKETLARLHGEEAEIPRIKAELAVARNNLARILAVYPAQLDEWITGKYCADVPRPGSKVEIQLPCEAIRARPDIRRAERAIAKEVAEVGVAVADVYPRLSLNGILSYETLQTGGASTVGHLLGGTNFVKSIFDSGANRARIQRREAILQQVVKDYESLVYQSVMEVENALSRIHLARERVSRLNRAVDASDDALKSLRAAYDEGLIDVRDLLLVQQQRFERQVELLFAKNEIAQATILLYKAAGGDDIPGPPCETCEGIDVTCDCEPTKATRDLSQILSTGMDPYGLIRRQCKNIKERTWLKKKDDGCIVPAGECADESIEE